MSDSHIKWSAATAEHILSGEDAPKKKLSGDVTKLFRPSKHEWYPRLSMGPVEDTTSYVWLYFTSPDSAHLLAGEPVGPIKNSGKSATPPYDLHDAQEKIDNLVKAAYFAQPRFPDDAPIWKSEYCNEFDVSDLYHTLNEEWKANVAPGFQAAVGSDPREGKSFGASFKMYDVPKRKPQPVSKIAGRRRKR